MTPQDERTAQQEPLTAERLSQIEDQLTSAEFGVSMGILQQPETVNLTRHCRALWDELAQVRAALSAMTQERDEARAFGLDAARQYNDLLAAAGPSVAIVTCAFCGVTYPAGTPRHGDGLLAEHIQTCEQHPMRLVEQRAVSAERALAEARTPQGTCANCRDWTRYKQEQDDSMFEHAATGYCDNDELLQLNGPGVVTYATFGCRRHSRFPPVASAAAGDETTGA